MTPQSKSPKEKSKVQTNIMTLTVLTSAIIIIVNIALFFYISRAINVINTVYSTNVTIGELSDALSQVRSSMTEYLNTKSTDSMEQYFDACQQYRYESYQQKDRSNREFFLSVHKNTSVFLEMLQSWII